MSKMMVNELHAALVHAPLTLLPTAAVADLIAHATGDRSWEKLGRRLWVAGTASALVAGTTGLAASQEVRMRDPVARDMVFLHGTINTVVALGAVGVTLWRLGNKPNLVTCALGVVANTVALYSAALGGKMVYDHGVGITAMPAGAPQGVGTNVPPLLSREAPGTLLRDAVRGFSWLLGRAQRLLSGAQPLTPGAEGIRDEESMPAAPTFGSPTLDQPRV
jgi:uncharacterized membrane protein